MTERSVLLDTSFFLRLFDTNSPLHENAKTYYKYFLEHDIILKNLYYYHQLHDLERLVGRKYSEIPDLLTD